VPIAALKLRYYKHSIGKKFHPHKVTVIITGKPTFTETKKLDSRSTPAITPKHLGNIKSHIHNTVTRNCPISQTIENEIYTQLKYLTFN